MCISHGVKISKFHMLFPSYSFFFKKYFIYLFLERGEGKEKEKERNISVWLPLLCPQLGPWPETQACGLTGNQTGDPLVHRLALNEPHQPGCAYLFFFQ